MANYLTHAVNKFLDPRWSVLDLCCGNGLVSDGYICRAITGVDVYRPYLNQYLECVKNSDTLEIDLAKIAQNTKLIQPHAYDVVVCADGVEHLDPKASLDLIAWMERIAKVRVVVFTPLNINKPGSIVLNTPHDAWGIEGGNNWQEHRCGYAPEFFIDRGYKAYKMGIHRNVYDDTPYAEMLYVRDNPATPQLTKSYAQLRSPHEITVSETVGP